MGGIVRNLKGKAIAIGGTTNHAHLVIGLPSEVAPAEAVGKIKANLTGWVHGTSNMTSGTFGIDMLCVALCRPATVAGRDAIWEIPVETKRKSS